MNMYYIVVSSVWFGTTLSYSHLGSFGCVFNFFLVSMYLYLVVDLDLYIYISRSLSLSIMYIFQLDLDQSSIISFLRIFGVS